MLFSSLIFLFAFLPLLILVYYAMPSKGRNAVLLLFSLVFYAWGEPKYLVYILASITIGYLAGLLIHRFRGKLMAKLAMILATVSTLGLLGYFKYADLFITTINGVIGSTIPLLKLALPIGISFYTFQILSYVIDVYRGNSEVQKNPINFGAYVVFFPQLIAGPIVRYVDIEQQLRTRHCSWDMAYRGAVRFLVGLGKKVLLANQLGALVAAFDGSAEQSVLFTWLSLIAYMMQLYLDFSGYSDMAIGLGRLFGFEFPENFNYPFLSVSLTEFWRRWHMTLGTWFRDYVYIPLGGNRVSKGRWLMNIIIVWGLTGFWHGAGWNFLLWGLIFGAALIGEKLWYGRFLEKNRWFGHIYTLVVFLFTLVLFRANNLTEALRGFSSLFGLHGQILSNTETLYHLRSNLILLLVSVVACTPVPVRVMDWCEKSKLAPVVNVLKPIGLVVILLLSTAFMVDGSFNPFLYFRF